MTDSRQGGKSANAFRTISEVATELDVPPHVLRFWEGKFSQIRPMKRGGGRRYYRPEDVEVIKRIKKLLYDDGFTIKGAQKFMKTGVAGPEDKEPTTEVQAEAPAAAQAAPAQAAPAAPKLVEAAPVVQTETIEVIPANLQKELGAAIDELLSLKSLLQQARQPASA